LCRDRSDLIRSLLLELMGLFNAGRLHPLPLLAFPIEHAPDAFQYMARRKNVGKIVLRVDDRQTVSTAEPCREIRPDSTYLIVGGLGGLGLATAAWMARKGARHLVLMGRTTAAADNNSVIKALQEQGVEIVVSAGDVAQEADVFRVLDGIRSSMPP